MAYFPNLKRFALEKLYFPTARVKAVKRFSGV